VGVVLIGLQRFVDSRGRAEPQSQSQTQSSAPAAPTIPIPSPPAFKPKPSPVPPTKAQAESKSRPFGPITSIPSPPASKPEPKPSPAQQTKAPEAPSKKAPEAPSKKAPEAQAKKATEAPSKKAPEEPSKKASAEQAKINASQPAPQPGVPQRTIQFVTDPAGATVTLDSGQTCSSPCLLDLAPGRHTLSAQLAGYRVYQKVFSVPQDSDIFLSLAKASATLSITSTPPGAMVQLNGAGQDRPTPLLLTLAPGTYHVRVSRNGVPLDFDVTLRDGEFISKNVSF